MYQHYLNETNHKSSGLESAAELSQFKIIALTTGYLSQAIKLVNNSFRDEDTEPGMELMASLNTKGLAEYQNRNPEIVSLDYYIAVTSDAKVVGIVGLYEQSEDCRETTLWLGWYCVDRKYRGLKIGKKLLEHAIEKAKSRQAKFLALYTSTHKEEAKAQLVYDKFGFEITHRVKKRNYDLLYRRKAL